MFSRLKKNFNKDALNGYFFIHIPKTAGTSFITLLDTIVAENEIFPCQLWHEINQKVIDRKKQYKLLRGHFGGGSYKLLCENTPHRLTILRHPQSLTLSTYHFIKREKNTAVHDLVNNNEMSLVDFLNEPLTSTKIENRMVRHLSFDLQEDPEAQELFLSEQSVKVIEKWIKTPKIITPQKRLKRALKVIDECSWFGIQERFDESMQLFCYRFNLPPVGKSPKLNVFEAKERVDETCENLISKHNLLDIELYRYASKKFSHSYEKMCAQLKNDFGKNFEIDELIDLNYKKNHTPSIENTINFDFSGKLLGNGWNRRELTHPENTFFRWTSRKDSWIDFWVENKSFELSLRIINAVTEEHLNKLDLQINSESIPYHYDTSNGVVRILKTQIPQNLIENNLIRITFKLPPIQLHSQSFNSDDKRPVGLAINWIKLN